jgi:uncharacterized protein YcbX
MMRPMQSIGTVLELWRYPVKSMAGERVTSAELRDNGFAGDRLWALRDEARGEITSAKKLPAILLCSARLAGEQAVITLPDGAEVRSDDPDVHARLSAALGREVTLCALRPASDADHYRAAKMSPAERREIFGVADDEPLPDFSMLPVGVLAELARFATPRGTYFDAFPVHVVTTASLAALRAKAPEADVDARRFRPNVVVETGGAELLEHGWTGATLSLGDARLSVAAPTVRCSMPMRPQPGLGASPPVLRALTAHTDRCLGAYATVERGASVSVGANVAIELARENVVGRAVGAATTALKKLAIRAATGRR